MVEHSSTNPMVPGSIPEEKKRKEDVDESMEQKDVLYIKKTSALCFCSIIISFCLLCKYTLCLLQLYVEV